MLGHPGDLQPSRCILDQVLWMLLLYVLSWEMTLPNSGNTGRFLSPCWPHFLSASVISFGPTCQGSLLGRGSRAQCPVLLISCGPQRGLHQEMFFLSGLWWCSAQQTQIHCSISNTDKNRAMPGNFLSGVCRDFQKLLPGPVQKQ